MRSIIVIFLLLKVLPTHAQKGFSFVDREIQKKVDILHNGKLITSYCYFDSTEKPILFPVKTLNGVTITRGYPIAPRAGERTDHPHHTGIWFNYESVNGLDFWNNSFAIPEERKHRYGSIRHVSILDKSIKKERAFLKTKSNWVDQKGNVLLEEITEFTFSNKNGVLVIDRAATLTAKMSEVVFKDVKDGMIAIRVARELEMPSLQQDKFVDAMGNVTDVPLLNNKGVTGVYINKEGVKGDDVWGKRSAWTYLTGEKEGVTISIGIIDHPKNIGYPTYWHARGYGLFAANPLGQKVFSNGKEEMSLRLTENKSITFKYRFAIKEGSVIKAEEMNQLSSDFLK
ncbi:PmoA family protein [Chryseosolibacter indicus]|uniref:PmoA family protein n=1 Tax=Chryseosolibacter indicus TaxID=2782351 RepID=A0ABS5VKY4_9BACT|nr:PmoA family protein [Chryseosolibacter indicus]